MVYIRDLIAQGVDFVTSLDSDELVVISTCQKGINEIGYSAPEVTAVLYQYDVYKEGQGIASLGIFSAEDINGRSIERVAPRTFGFADFFEQRNTPDDIFFDGSQKLFMTELFIGYNFQPPLSE